MDQSDRDRLKALCAEATAGPWAMDPDESDGLVVWSDSGARPGHTIADIRPAHLPYSGNGAHDAAFIATARQAVPDLLDANAALRARVDRFETADWVTNDVHRPVLAERDALRARVEELTGIIQGLNDWNPETVAKWVSEQKLDTIDELLGVLHQHQEWWEQFTSFRNDSIRAERDTLRARVEELSPELTRALDETAWKLSAVGTPSDMPPALGEMTLHEKNLRRIGWLARQRDDAEKERDTALARAEKAEAAVDRALVIVSQQPTAGRFGGTLLERIRRALEGT